jgi:hypothetical protein
VTAHVWFTEASISRVQTTMDAFGVWTPAPLSSYRAEFVDDADIELFLYSGMRNMTNLDIRCNWLDSEGVWRAMPVLRPCTLRCTVVVS